MPGATQVQSIIHLDKHVFAAGAAAIDGPFCCGPCHPVRYNDLAIAVDDLDHQQEIIWDQIQEPVKWKAKMFANVPRVLNFACCDQPLILIIGLQLGQRERPALGLNQRLKHLLFGKHRIDLGRSVLRCLEVLQFWIVPRPDFNGSRFLLQRLASSFRKDIQVLLR